MTSKSGEAHRATLARDREHAEAVELAMRKVDRRVGAEEGQERASRATVYSETLDRALRRIDRHMEGEERLQDTLDRRLSQWKRERGKLEVRGEVPSLSRRGHEAGARREKQDSLTWELWRAQEWARSGMVEPPRAELRTFVLCLVHEGVEQLEG